MRHLGDPDNGLIQSLTYEDVLQKRRDQFIHKKNGEKMVVILSLAT